MCCLSCCIICLFDLLLLFVYNHNYVVGYIIAGLQVALFTSICTNCIELWLGNTFYFSEVLDNIFDQYPTDMHISQWTDQLVCAVAWRYISRGQIERHCQELVWLVILPRHKQQRNQPNQTTPMDKHVLY